MKLEVMVTSRWSAQERRQIQRHALRSCAALVDGGRHEVEVLFFMGEPNGTQDSELAAREEAEFGDLVRVGGPDTDPPVPRDATYVLDRPCARTYRIAHGSAWLAEHRPDLDYVMYLDDDSFLHLPKLLHHLEFHHSESLAMGYIMETKLDWADTHVCELCEPCKPCRTERGLLEFCGHFPDMALGGCIMAVQNCKIFDAEADDGAEGLASCVAGKREGILRLSQYFGSKVAPRWLLGMGWVFGSRVVRYVGRNAHRLKVRGAADVSLGFWLAPLEAVRFASMNTGQFHDHPETRSTFAARCTDQTVLVHRMNPLRWESGFRADSCEMLCDGVPGNAAE